ncbi:MAG: hypothetical protein MHM6MM_007600 [Cercozoa sp. M6MM]
MRLLTTLIALSMPILTLGSARAHRDAPPDTDTAPRAVPQSGQSLPTELTTAVAQTRTPWPTSFEPPVTPAAPSSPSKRLRLLELSESGTVLTRIALDAETQRQFAALSVHDMDFVDEMEHLIVPVDVSNVGNASVVLSLVWLAAVHSKLEHELPKVAAAVSALAREQQTSTQMEMLEAANFLGATKNCANSLCGL